jgi:hypothetical protein
MGINKLWCAFDSDSIPEVDESTMVPYDTMHVELDGLVRMEMAYLLYMLISKKKYFTLVQLNAAIKAFEWPKGQRMPAVDPKVVEGAKGRVPRPDAHLFSSASQTMYFALARYALPPLARVPPVASQVLTLCPNSEQIIGALLSEAAKREPCWLCWITHTRYLSILTQHVISREELNNLATLIEEHQSAFAKERARQSQSSQPPRLSMPHPSLQPSLAPSPPPHSRQPTPQPRRCPHLAALTAASDETVCTTVPAATLAASAIASAA